MNAMPPRLESLVDGVSLKHDGRRVSLEGALTGVALGLVLIYLVEDEVKAASRREGAGPVDAPGNIDLGDFKAQAGRIELGQPETLTLNARSQKENDGGQGPVDIGPGFLGGGGSAGLPRQQRRAEEPVKGISLGVNGSTAAERADQPLGTPEMAQDAVGIRQSEYAQRQPSKKAAETIPTSSLPNAPADGGPQSPRGGPLPQLMLVLVRTVGDASSRSLGGTATSLFNGRQVAINESSLDLRSAEKPRLEVQSERLLPLSAFSGDEDVVVEMINSHVDLISSTILGGSLQGSLVLQAKDVLDLALKGNKSVIVNTRDVAGNLEESTLMMGTGNDLVALNALAVLQFSSLGTSKGADLTFSLLTRNLRDSLVDLGDGDDRLMMASGFYRGGDTFDSSSTKGKAGIALSFGEGAMAIPEEAWSLSLDATAIGAENSFINLGEGNNTAIILTRIDEDLDTDLGSRLIAASTQITLDRVGLKDTVLKAGSGDDDVRITGRVVRSTIDLGGGSNQLVLEEGMDEPSMIVLGSGSNKVLINGGLGGALQGGAGADRLELSGRELAGVFDGGGGKDTLAGAHGEASKRDIAILQGEDSGYFNSIRFRNVETLDLGGNDDIVIMALEGTLTGRCLGGDGLDRLEFSNWTLPVQVDLDLGTATGINGGISGFEEVNGGLGDDVLVASGKQASLMGGPGNDVLWMRWTPWTADVDSGLKLSGGAGSDLFVFDGLGAKPPDTWNHHEGLPTLVDLDLTGGIGIADRLAWTQDVQLGDGVKKELIELTPSDIQGVGDIRLLPIAPLDQLLAGMSDSTRQLAIAYDRAAGVPAAELHLLGAEGKGTSQAIAVLQSGLLDHRIERGVSQN